MPTEHAGAQRLRRLLEAVVTINSELDLPSVLERVVEAAVELVDARYGALGVLDETSTELAEFITVGIDEPTRLRIGDLPKGLGLLGVLIHDAMPLRLADLREHPDSVGFPPGHPPMTSFLGVPIKVRGEVFGNLYLTDKKSGKEFTEVDEELALGLATSAAVAIENARLFGQVQRREAMLAAMHEVAAALLVGVDVNESLQMVASRARELVGGELATVALPQADGESLVIDIVDGPLSDGFAGTSYPIRGSVSGEVMRFGEMIVVEDASKDHRTLQPQVSSGRVGPAVWISLVSDDRPFGSLSVARAPGQAPFTPAELEVISSFATQASIILEHHRARQKLQRLVVLENEERIARDMHDTVIQRLFATGMLLQATTRMVTDPQARERLTAAVDDLDLTIRHIRTVIFELEDVGSVRGGSVRSRVLAITSELARVLGFEPSVSFIGPLETFDSELITSELLSTLREALSNVARHAGARHVEVSLALEDEAVRIAIEDDGVGMDPKVLQDSPGRGLRNMAMRAERYGGSLDIEPARAGGTRLCLSLPIAHA
jgi:signal transduction histidine kinase